MTSQEFPFDPFISLWLHLKNLNYSHPSPTKLDSGIVSKDLVGHIIFSGDSSNPSIFGLKKQTILVAFTQIQWCASYIEILKIHCKIYYISAYYRFKPCINWRTWMTPGQGCVIYEWPFGKYVPYEGRGPCISCSFDCIGTFLVFTFAQSTALLYARAQ